MGNELIHIDDVKQSPEMDDELISCSFIINYGGSLSHVFYKKIYYRDSSNQEKECLVKIKKFLFFVVSIKYPAVI
jgi:hypothetical protein